MLTKCAFYCLAGFGLYSAILDKSGVAVSFCENILKKSYSNIKKANQTDRFAFSISIFQKFARYNR